MTEVITRKSRNIPDGKELFEGISGNFEEFGQTLCELTDNSISNFLAHHIRGHIEITLTDHGTYVDVSVRDSRHVVGANSGGMLEFANSHSSI